MRIIGESLDAEIAHVDPEWTAALGFPSEHPAQHLVRVAAAVKMALVHAVLMVSIASRHDVFRIVAPALGAEDDVMAV